MFNLSMSSTPLLTIVLLAASYLFIRLRKSVLQDQPETITEAPPHPSILEAASRIKQCLLEAFPDSVLSPQDAAALNNSSNINWARRESQRIPACAFRPLTVEQIAEAVKLICSEYKDYEAELRRAGDVNMRQPLFAIRSGGHSPAASAASISGGILIDLSGFSSVTVSEHANEATIGTGARWGSVYEYLSSRKLAVVGGRNSDIGVGGYLLGGGISFYTQRMGLACSNVVSYQIVLATGEITTASASHNPDLWRALKGGSNNFGIVTHFTVRTFEGGNVWAGLMYMPMFQAPKVLRQFHEFVARVGDASIDHDVFATCPLISFNYVRRLRMEIAVANLIYTKARENDQDWPDDFKTMFKPFWRYWNTCKTKSLKDRCDEDSATAEAGKYQAFGVTTIKNDWTTLEFVRTVYKDSVEEVKRAKVNDAVFSLALQALLPGWVQKGHTGPLGLDSLQEPLVVVLFCPSWADSHQPDLVQQVTRRAVARIDDFAQRQGTSHPYRYLSYCGEWQKPLQSYGEENLTFLREVSKKYDPEGLFQKGAAGPFKLDRLDL